MTNTVRPSSPEEQSHWFCDRRIPSTIEAGQQLIDELLSNLQRRRWGEHDIFSVHLAVEEALVNAIKHGNGGNPNKVVRFVCRLSHCRVCIEIADQGEGFDPQCVPNPTDEENLERPCGRGVMLMQSFMTRVDYNETGNRVVMEKYATRSGRC